MGCEPGVLAGREVIGAFTQLPFKLASAITIHKSQGQTLDRLIKSVTKTRCEVSPLTGPKSPLTPAWHRYE